MRKGDIIAVIALIVVLCGGIMMKAFPVRTTTPADLKINETFDARGTSTQPIANDATLLLAYQSVSPGSNDEKLIEARVARWIVDQKLTHYARFVVASDSTSQVVLTYPGCRVVLEGK